MTKRIIVCGIYRSGTSLTTQLVREWGVYAGKPDDLFEDEFGYLEHLALQKFNDELLGGNSRVPTPVNVLLEKSKDPDWKSRALRALAHMDAETQAQGAAAWVWKDPRLPLAMPFWADFLRDAIFVIPVRHPVETILSAAKMEGLDPENTPLSAGLVYWQFCMLNILEATKDAPHKIFIAYDRLIQNPSEEVLRLCSFLDKECGVGDADSGPRMEAMASHIRETQRHFKSPTSLADLEVATPEQRALFNFLRVKTMYPHETYRPDDFALYPGWMEYLQAMDALVSILNEGQA